MLGVIWLLSIGFVFGRVLLIGLVEGLLHREYYLCIDMIGGKASPYVAQGELQKSYLCLVF